MLPTTSPAAMGTATTNGATQKSPDILLLLTTAMTRQGGTVSKALAFIVTFFFFFTFILRSELALEYSTIVAYPGVSILYVWQLFFAGFVQSYPFSIGGLLLFIIHLTTILLCGRYLENVLGSYDFFRLVMITFVSSFFFTSLTMLFVIMFASSDSSMITSSFHGLSPLIGAFTVAYKQLIPEHAVSLLNGILAFRVKYVPGILLLSYSILLLLHLFPMVVFLSYAARALPEYFLLFFGMLSSWIWLRFVRVSDGIQGDRSEGFSFASFWPEPLHPVVIPVSNSVYKAMESMGIMKRLTSSSRMIDTRALYQALREASSGSGGGSSSKVILGDSEAEAERRRNLALQTLNERLAQKASMNGASSKGDASVNMT